MSLREQMVGAADKQREEKSAILAPRPPPAPRAPRPASTRKPVAKGRARDVLLFGKNKHVCESGLSFFALFLAGSFSSSPIGEFLVVAAFLSVVCGW